MATKIAYPTNKSNANISIENLLLVKEFIRHIEFFAFKIYWVDLLGLKTSFRNRIKTKQFPKNNALYNNSLNNLLSL